MQTCSKTNKCGVDCGRQIHAAKSDITCSCFTYLETVACDRTHVVGRVVKLSLVVLNAYANALCEPLQCFFADVFGEHCCVVC